MNNLRRTAESWKETLSYRWRLAVTVALALLLVAACGPKGANQLPEEELPDPTTTGSINIAVNGLTAGTMADITVTGPDSYRQDITAASELKGLQPGAYTVTAVAVPGHNLVGAAVQAVEVKAGEVSVVTVAYTTLPVGSLTINVNGLAAGIPAAIAVTGSDFSESITETTTLPNLPVGTYSVEVGPVAGHVLISANSFDVDVEDGKEASETVSYAAAGLSVTSAIANPQLPLQTEIDLHFNIVRSGALTGEVNYEVTGATGFKVESWNDAVAAGTDSFTITVTDDAADLGTYTLNAKVSGTAHGHVFEDSIEVELDLVAVVTDGSDDAAPTAGSLRALLNDTRTDGATVTFAEDLLAADLNIALAAPLEFEKNVSIAGPSGWSANPGPRVNLGGANTFTPVIINNAASVTLANIQVHDGSAVNGGGIQVHPGSQLTLDGVYVLNNVASGNGGGIWNRGILKVENDSRIFQNESGLHGGGVWTDHANAIATFEDSIVSYNDAQVRGGGLYLGRGTLTLRNTAVRHNEAENGGGILAQNNGAASGLSILEVLDGSEVVSNKADNGAGIFSYAEATIADSIIKMNSALLDGGGIRNHLRMMISDTEVTENDAGADYGGVFNDGIMTISDSIITLNTVGGDGGGIFNGWYGSDSLNGLPKQLSIESTLVADNTAGVDGGGIHSVRRLEIIDSTIEANTATSGEGGGIYAVSIPDPGAPLNNGGELHINGSSITNNKAGLEGGGIYSENKFIGGGGPTPIAPLSIVNSTVSGNEASNGGGIYMWGLNNGPVNIAFSTIANNRAMAPDGTSGGILNGRDLVTLRGNIVAHNYAMIDPNDHDVNSSKPMTSAGYNVLSTNPHTNVGLGATDVTSVSVIQLFLLELADNGGGTQTRALGVGSAAAGIVPVAACVAPDGSLLATDQRGLPRPGSSGLCSSGSFEVQSAD